MCTLFLYFILFHFSGYMVTIWLPAGLESWFSSMNYWWTGRSVTEELRKVALSS